MFWHLYDHWVRPDIVLILHLIIALTASGHAVLHKEEPRAAVGWVGLIWLSPLIGALLYYLLGINRIRRSAVSLLGRSEATAPHHHGRNLLHASGIHSADMDQLSHLGDHVVGLPLTSGNRVALLNNGDEAYPAMLGAIHAAKSTIVMASYIFDCDAAGKVFASALAQAVQRGVEVRVLIDATGSRYSFPSIISHLRRAGVRTARFMPNLQPTRIAAINLRSHRKILVTDGTVGFTGGINIRAGNWLSQGYPNPIQDLHFKVEGPVVGHLRRAFAEDWVFTTREVLTGELWQPPLSEVEGGDILARGVLDGPDRDFEKTLWTILGAITAARRRIRIVTPYFLPDPTMVRFLSVAAMSGIEVEIILPRYNNIPPVHWAAMAIVPPLLQRHCRIYLADPPFDHSKMMLIDEAWALIGSANWDARSLRLNFEFNIECFSERFAGIMNAAFEAKRSRAQLLPLAELQKAKLPARLRNGIMRLGAPYL